jgi:hypothetical protein
LILNVFVSLISFLNYRKAAVFPMRLFLTLVIFSVPAAYLGGRILLDATIYKQVLGVLLLFPVLRFAGLFPVSAQPKFTQQPWMVAILGGSIGLLSGMIGIGGGIILSPDPSAFGMDKCEGNRRRECALYFCEFHCWISRCFRVSGGVEPPTVDDTPAHRGRRSPWAPISVPKNGAPNS